LGKGGRKHDDDHLFSIWKTGEGGKKRGIFDGRKKKKETSREESGSFDFAFAMCRSKGGKNCREKEKSPSYSLVDYTF